MRPMQICCKLLQRQAYTCLSTRAGIWFCLGGLIVLGISALQFGEVFLEWSMQRYKVAFSTHHDNIAERTFEDRLCLPGPIDVVYTWVNGSDPQLIKQLNEVKAKLMQELNKTKINDQDEQLTKPYEILKKATKKDKSSNNRRSGNSEEKFKWKEDNKCPYPNCLPFNAIAISGLPKNVTEFKISAENRFLPSFEFSNFDNTVDPSIKVLLFGEHFSFETLNNKSVKFEGKKVKFAQVFVSSTIRLGAKKVEGIGMINYVPNDITTQTIEAGLKRNKVDFAKVSLVNNTSIIQFMDGRKSNQFLGTLRGQLNLKGKKFKVFPATLLWKPLTALEKGRDIIEEDVSSSRFADNDELRYSLRSIQKYAPWVRQIFIVTNGQIPSWLNLDHPRIKVVTHEEIFVNKSHLPTFSSPAIETHIHRIPGLSKQFIYMNDDVFFGDYVWPDDFFTHSKGQKVYLTWPVPNCNEGCPATWINDKYCDKPCNVSECDWDGGDCLGSNAAKIFSLTSHSLHGSAYSAIGEYCNGGCANSWIGDRYCDVNCNVFDCGFDAGDCGPQKFENLFSIDADNAKNFIRIPVGNKAFYFNFSRVLGDGVLTEGEFSESSVVRTAIFSKKFKIMTITLYANFTETVAFKVSGYKDVNQTVPIHLQFNISVDTTKSLASTTLRPATQTTTLITGITKIGQTLYPYTVYNKLKKKPKVRDENVSRISNKTMSEVFEWYRSIGRDIPEVVKEELNKTKVEWDSGDLTQFGYNRRKFKIIQPLFYLRKKNNPGNEADSDKKNPLQRSRRHLLSIIATGELQAHKSLWLSNPRSKIQKRQHFPRPMRILDELSEKPKHQKIDVDIRKNDATSRGSHILHHQKWLSRYGHWDPIGDAFATSPLRWERQEYFLEVLSKLRRLERQNKYSTSKKPRRKLLDTFASSLLHVSRIYNREFGYKARKVPAHMPHYVDVNVVNEMQNRFWSYFDETSSHKIRSPSDMQFAFSYSYYLMDLLGMVNMSNVFQEMDTDESGTLNDRELRTLAAKMYSLPLQPADIENLEDIVSNCSGLPSNVSKESDNLLSALMVPKHVFMRCKQIEKKLMESYKGNKFKFELIGDEDVTFKMIRNNVSLLIFQLDWVRKNRRKFICLNDNINHELPQSKLIRTILKDFLESQYPEKSQFELPHNYRNMFLKVDELRKWKEDTKKYEEKRRIVFGLILFVFIVFILKKQFFRIFRRFMKLFDRRVNSLRGLSLNEEEVISI